MRNAYSGHLGSQLSVFQCLFCGLICGLNAIRSNGKFINIIFLEKVDKESDHNDILDFISIKY